MINFSEKEIQASMAISFSTSAILDICQKMLGENPDDIDNLVIDVVGEITTMITGRAKRMYSEQGLEFNLTLPTVTIGHNTSLQHSVEDSPCLAAL